MKELIERYGYKFIGNCHCDGFQTSKYSKEGYELRIREKKNMFKLKLAGRSLTMWIPLDTLAQTLLNTHQHTTNHRETVQA